MDIFGSPDKESAGFIEKEPNQAKHRCLLEISNSLRVQHILAIQ